MSENRFATPGKLGPLLGLVILFTTGVAANSPRPRVTRTWDGGGADSNWSTAANWSGDTVPVAGDALVFDGTTRLASTNDLAAGTSFVSLTFLSGGFSLSGNSITLAGPITNSAGTNAVGLAVALTGATDISVEPGTSLAMSGVISGSVALTKTGTGTLTLSATNTYTGATSISAGLVIVTSSSAFGDAAVGTTIASGASMRLQCSYFVNEDLTINGTGISGSGAIEVISGSAMWSGPITLGSSSLICVPNGGLTLVNGINMGSFDLTFDGAGAGIQGAYLSGSGSVTKLGSMTVRLASGTYTGVTYVNAGAIGVGPNNGLGTTGAGTIVADGGYLAIQTSANYTSPEPVTISGTGPNAAFGVIQHNSGSNTTFAGVITLAAASVIRSQSPNVTMTLSGPINNAGYGLTVRGDWHTTLSGVLQGSGTLTKADAGTLTMTATNTATGAATVNGGTLRLDGTLAVPITVNAGASLVGSGTAGAVTMVGASTISPGTVSTQGLLNTGNLALASASTFSAQINGPAPGTGYDQVNVTGTVDLAGATLSLSGPTAGGGRSWILVNNDGTDPVVGTFSGLADGATFSMSSRTYRIDYDGGDGNDVVITHVMPIYFTTTSTSISESSGPTVQVYAQISENCAADVTIPLTVTGTASNPQDYTLSAASITILAGQQSGYTTLTLVNDLLDEDNETVVFALDLSSSLNLSPGNPVSITLQINDEDPTPTVTWSAATQSADESVGAMTATATLSAVSGRAITVPFSVGGTAGNPGDYTITSSPLTIPAGSPNGAVTITVVGDSQSESNKTVVVSMGTPTNATAGAITTHTATIIDDDPTVVTGVTSSRGNGTYGIGQVIAITVTFSEGVYVTGTPQLTLETGTVDAVLDLQSGSGSTTLTFVYTIASGHASSDLDYGSGASLTLNGGTIRDSDLNDANLSLAAPGLPGSLGYNKDLVIVSRVPPGLPTGVEQRRSDGSSHLVVGGTTGESTVTFRGVGNHPDPAESVRLQVEARPTGAPFIESATAEGPLERVGASLRAVGTGIADGSYHWQCRLVDSSGLMGDWTPFGDNTDPGTPDFIVAVTPGNSAPGTPLALGQFRHGGPFPLGVGATVSDGAITFKGRVIDPDAEGVRLEIQHEPLGAPFAVSSPTHYSDFLPSGSVATVTVLGLANGSRHWRARAVDALGGASPYVEFGGNAPMIEADFTVDVSTNSTPQLPANLAQHDNPGGSAQGPAYVDDDSQVVFRATVGDANVTQMLRLQVEVRAIADAFTGIPTAESLAVTSGARAEIVVNGLPDGDYHWQARTVDSTGAASAFMSFGGNPEGSADFSVLGAPTTSPYGANAGQYMGDGTTLIPVGSSTGHSTVVLRIRAMGSAGYSCRIQVEMRDVPSLFLGVQTQESDWIPSGAYATFTMTGFPPGNYHWRYRVIDELGAMTGWVQFGGNLDSETDFYVNPATNLPPSLAGTTQCRTDGVTAIAQGGSTSEATILIRGDIDSGDPGQLARLRIEVRPSSEALIGVPTGASPWAPSGSVAQAVVSGLVVGEDYQWQAWVEDTNGVMSAIIPFPGDPDFTRTANTAPAGPSGLGQRRLSGFVMGVGGTSNQSSVILSGTGANPGDTVQLEVEIQPVGFAFVGAPSVAGDPVPGGSSSDALVDGLIDMLGYHWQGRTVDSSGAASAWVPFGSNTDPADADFTVNLAYSDPAPPSGGGGGGGGGGGCGAGEGPGNLAPVFWVVLVLILCRWRRSSPPGA